ncbi:retropepsin-like aspartic protease [Caulobacter sp. RL271]|jgi:predicted aspartyl protease|uniref:Retroviral-like aspartic protease family protein n=1 Tax=Caulobacter segnis TaxID=88688 RepID=A0ABY4ZNS5_9CAUL|nr:retropepsin-like aspartic protease [Caulobacter segnis]USQ93672.1 retroviral-like aspartic protease family protein [Caulobacter segnis]
MFTRRHIAAGLGFSLAAPSALAGAITPVSLSPVSLPQTPLATPQAPPGEPPLLILDASLDQDARLTVPVMINGQGPFQFVVDTGADRSVLTPGLAERLALPRGPDVIVHGVSGSIISTTARVAQLRTGDARLAEVVLPVLPYDRVGADGLLGVDILEDRNVVIDFRRKQLEVRRSQSISQLLRSSREVSVVADERFGRLTIADSRIAGARSLAFIDSGGGVSIGNMALARAIAARRRRSSDMVQQARLLTAGGEMQLGEFRVVPSIVMGDLRITNIPMAFADLHIFDVWNLNNRPAALLGVDVLRLFARVELDFGAGRVLFRLGQGGLAAPLLNA